MRIITYLGWKTLALTASVALVVGWSAWMILPPSPRVTIPLGGRTGPVAFSSDCRFVAFPTLEMVDKGNARGELRVWDTHLEQLLFAVPYEESYPPVAVGGYSLAFTPPGDKLVTFSWGKPKFHLVPSGEPWEPDVKHEFPHDGVPSMPSKLISDAKGDLYPEWLAMLLTKLGHRFENWVFVVYDPSTGQEVASLRHGGVAQFSLDGKTLAIETEQPHAIELYDVPLSNPWGKIAGIALGCAGGIFVTAQCVRWRRRKRTTSLASACQPPAM